MKIEVERRKGARNERDGMSIGSEGMTLRDWFAGQALIGLLSAYGPHAKENKHGLMISETIFETAWNSADAMLSARNGGGT